MWTWLQRDECLCGTSGGRPESWKPVKSFYAEARERIERLVEKKEEVDPGAFLEALGVPFEGAGEEALSEVLAEVLDAILGDCADALCVQPKNDRCLSTPIARHAFESSVTIAFALVTKAGRCDPHLVKVYLRSWTVWGKKICSHLQTGIKLLNLIQSQISVFFSHKSVEFRLGALEAWRDFGAHWLSEGGEGGGLAKKHVLLLNKPFVLGRYPLLKKEHETGQAAVRAWVAIFILTSGSFSLSLSSFPFCRAPYADSLSSSSQARLPFSLEELGSWLRDTLDLVAANLWLAKDLEEEIEAIEGFAESAKCPALLPPLVAYREKRRAQTSPPLTLSRGFLRKSTTWSPRKKTNHERNQSR